MRLAVLLSCALFAQTLQASPPARKDSAGWVGADACLDCHSDEYALWKDSHHDLAMQEVSPATVLGNFENAGFSYAGVNSRFFRKGEEFWVETDNAKGELEAFRIAYVFGVYPLQQYLVEFPGGRLQTLGIAWDSRPAAEGGQRWFHLYPDQAVTAEDPLHWTGPYQNWNLQCAECHSTHLEKNYDPAGREYRTTWSEINVACEACHGPGERHVAAARADTLANTDNGGFPLSLAERGGWAWPEGQDVARRTTPLPHSLQVENCGRCHARRGTIGDYHYGQDLLDTHRPALLRDPLYHADGQILDEVYVYGSFRQSKMYQAGVVCSNCHEPHSNALRAPGNGVCAQCHKPAVYDSAKHHRHVEGGAGSACVDCHMPARNYMVVDPRRDHSMRVPRPDLSLVIGTPNACTGCHSDRDDQWAVDRLRDWGVRFTDTSTHPARIMALARSGDGRAVPGLVKIAQDGSAPAIWRATAMQELGVFSNREALEAAMQLLQSDDPLLRWSAAGSVGMLPIQHRYVLLSRFIEDDNTAVRTEVARMLSEVPLEQIGAGDAAQLNALFEEYLHILGQQADTPEGLMEMGVFLVGRRLYEPAEQAYRNAMELNPRLLAAYLNLADLYRLQGRDDAGRPLLQEAGRLEPEAGAVWHALGLLETRSGNKAESLVYLERAAGLETQGIRHRYVYGVALQDAGRTEAALDVLRDLVREAPDNPDLLLALATYSKTAGRDEDARRYGARLVELMPDDPGVREFYKTL